MVYEDVEFINHVKLNYALIMNCELTPGGYLIDRLPYSYEWVDSVHEYVEMSDLLWRCIMIIDMATLEILCSCC